MKTYTVYAIAVTALALTQLVKHNSWPDLAAYVTGAVDNMAIKPPKPISVEPAKPLKPDASPDIVPQPPPIIGDDHGEAEHDTFDKLTDSANKETLTASLLLASQEICSYPHAMLKDAIEDLIASGRIDQNKVIAIAYAAQSWSAKETRVKATLCPGVIKIINENTRQRQQDGAQ